MLIAFVGKFIEMTFLGWKKKCLGTRLGLKGLNVQKKNLSTTIT